VIAWSDDHQAGRPQRHRLLFQRLHRPGRPRLGGRAQPRVSARRGRDGDDSRLRRPAPPEPVTRARRRWRRAGWSG